jgi:site-specific DNA-methyltransferase (adenine-specific)
MIDLCNQDCLEVMKGLPDNSIDAVITDPPYYSTNLHFDKQPRIDFEHWLNECKRVLKPNGVLVSFADFNLLAELKNYQAFKTVYELIFHKTMAVGYLDANRRPLKAHEFIGVFTNQLNKSTYNPQKTKGTPQKRSRHGFDARIYGKSGANNYQNPTGERHPVTVLKFSNGNNKSVHPTQKPLDLVDWLVRTYTNEGDTILDPFAGSGTTGVAAIKLNRHFIGCEIDKDYFIIAQQRIADAAHDLEIQFGT